MRNINQEWDFVVAETHCETPSESNMVKREILFYLQILLGQIGSVTNAIERRSLRKKYYGLKEIYGQNNINRHIVWKR